MWRERIEKERLRGRFTHYHSDIKVQQRKRRCSHLEVVGGDDGGRGGQASMP